MNLPLSIPDPIDPESEHIQFDLRYLRKKGKYSEAALKKKNPHALKTLEEKLAHYTKLTIQQFTTNNSGIRLKPLEGKPLRSFPKDLSPDIIDNQKIYEFRIDKKFRIMGYLKNDVFLVCWIDPNHEIAKG